MVVPPTPTACHDRDNDPTDASPNCTAPATIVGSSTVLSNGASTRLRSDTFLVTDNDLAPTSPIPAKFPSLVLDEEAESSFMTMYLDFVFPFLFPHYRPSVLDCGRHWLHHLVKGNDAVYHTSICLGAYFFTARIDSAYSGSEHNSYKDLVWEQLGKQTHAAIKTVQNEVNKIRCQGVGASLVQSARAMEGIIHMLIFEVMVGKSLDWNINLDATFVLFTDILTYPGKGSPQANLEAVLAMMGRSSWAALNFINPVPNTADQSALRFFTGILLFIDIVSSTALGQPPRLHTYHDNLLGQMHTQYDRIELDTIVGCQNWVLAAIGDISALDAWKKEAGHAGALSVVDLVRRSESISRALEQGLAQLDRIGADPTLPFDTAAEAYDDSLGLSPSTHRARITVTKIWALAACIYLSTVVSGWQPASHTVSQRVSQALDLFRGVPSAAQLRSLAWPLCVVGCLATAEQEQEFRKIVAVVGEFRVLGTIEEVLLTVEAVWKRRETLVRERWDLTKCLSVLGKPVLLI